MRKVLIIEDEAIISFGYRLQIERMGFEVIGVARSSAEAEALIALERPDLMIMDVYLKGPKTGLELAQEIHAKDPIPVVFLTASTKPEVVEAIRALKGSQYLAKPISSDGLSDVLEHFLRQHAER
ncbi:MAG: response regulator [Flavobacteriales bacterium]|jgi:response regulator of citrate/malate metabolism|nr:response regulator [Flavobacteriales bacterium]MBK6754317.1 response regulator [Flavobacteriales bacterium]MBK7086034.1 response regulator [Flavobacteriales bacterium]MBK7269604.1 response regulator [Flavobacteriales bacterium]MBK7753629.1 response regulator [Flavobacteriales bacterium]